MRAKSSKQRCPALCISHVVTVIIYGQLVAKQENKIVPLYFLIKLRID